MAVSRSSKVIKIRTNKGFSLEVKGYSEVLRGLKLTKNQTKRLQAFLSVEADKVIKTARSLVPIDTARLKDSHRKLHGGAGVGKRGHALRMDVVAGGLSMRGRFVDYASAVHEGSPRYPTPRPWLANALKLHAPGYTKRLARAIKLYKLGL